MAGAESPGAQPARQGPEPGPGLALAAAAGCRASASLAEIAAAENLIPSYVSWIAGRALLAPDIAEATLVGTLNQGVILDRLEKGVPTE